tara:strand:+ start:3857 stop:5608 length:1752 start_codon:yes stop_codon:yes gene_type:complete
MGQLTQTTTQLQTIIDDADASNAGNTSISDGSDTTATALKKSGFFSLGASSSNAPSSDRSVVISAVRNTSASGEIRYGQIVLTESAGLYWAVDDGGSLSSWSQAIGTTSTQTLTNKTLTSPVLTTPQINDSSADHQYIFAAANLAADRTVSLPLLGGNDTFVFEAHTQTLTNKTLTSAVLNTGVSGSAVLDEDDFASDSATKVATQQSIKAYVDSQVSGVTASSTTTFTNKTITAANNTLTLLATDIKIGEDDETKIDFEDADKINFYAGNEKQLILEDGVLYPGADNIIDLGKSDNEFKDAYFDGTVTADAFAGPLTGDVTGNVSGTAATVTGAAQSNITSLGTLTTLTVDNVIINATTIGHTDDTDLMTLANGVLTVAGEVSMTTLDIGGTNVTSTAAELNKLDGVGVLRQAGLETIYVPAAAMYPNSTNGCADLEQVELSNGPELKCLDFDPSSDENAQFTVCFPKSWNEGTVTFQAFWTVTGTNTGTVAWGLSGGSMADDASINTAFGTNVVATAKAFSGTSNDMTVSAVSGAVTIANAAADTQTYFQIMRDVSADSQSGDARLLGIKLFFTTDAANDS